MGINGLFSVVLLGILAIVSGFGYRFYISKNKDDFDEPLGKLYGISMILICGGIFIILLTLIIKIDKILR